MSSERIDELHQRASEHYLNGEYAQAIRAWRELLALEPQNEQALEGVRMSKLLGEGEPEAEADLEIDRGLSVFDSMPKPQAAARAATTPNDTMVLDRETVDRMLRETASAAESTGNVTDPGAGAPPTDLERQSEGIDFGDLDSVEPIALAGPSAGEVDAPEAPTPAEAADEAEPVGLEPVPEAHEIKKANAAVELKKRVADLLTEAKAEVEAGRRSEARAILSRVFILDEDNAEGRELEATLEVDSEGDLREIESWMIEGVQAFDQGRHEDARRYFEKVLGAHPEHREALHYLEKIREQEASFGDIPEDLLGGASLPADELSTPLPPSPEQIEPLPVAERPKRERPSRPEPSAAAAPVRRGFSLPKPVVAGAVGVLLVGLAAFFVPKLLGGGDASSPPLLPPPAPPRPAKSQAPAKGPETAAKPVAPADPAQLIARARSAMRTEDYGAAVIAYKAVLDADPANAEALEGIRDAGDRYKAQRAEQEQFERVRLAFHDGEYTSALRMLYRMPEGVDRAQVERLKADGWFDLGVVALRAGEVSQAIGHFDEVLSIQPDPDAARWRTFAMRYRNAPKDRSFYDAVESIRFR